MSVRDIIEDLREDERQAMHDVAMLTKARTERDKKALAAAQRQLRKIRKELAAAQQANW